MGPKWPPRANLTPDSDPPYHADKFCIKISPNGWNLTHCRAMFGLLPLPDMSPEGPRKGPSRPDRGHPEVAKGRPEVSWKRYWSLRGLSVARFLKAFWEARPRGLIFKTFRCCPRTWRLLPCVTSKLGRRVPALAYNCPDVPSNSPNVLK